MRGVLRDGLRVAALDDARIRSFIRERFVPADVGNEAFIRGTYANFVDYYGNQVPLDRVVAAKVAYAALGRGR